MRHISEKWDRRVAVVFFGSVRGIRWTRESIQRNVIDWNADRGTHLVTLGFINLFDRIDNPRSGETGVRLDRRDLALLPANRCVVIEQDDRDIEAPLQAARLSGDFYNNDFQSVRNLLHQLNSLRVAWDAITTDPNLSMVDAFLFLRPDLRYDRPIRIGPHIHKLSSGNTVLLPEWQSFGGFNDRLALADRFGAQVYATRLDHISDFCVAKPLQAELLLSHCLERGEVRVGRLNARARRVRGDGTVVPEAFGKSRRQLPRSPQFVTEIPEISKDTAPLRARDAVAAKMGRRGG